MAKVDNVSKSYEGQEIQDYITAIMEDDSILADELTVGRIRTIYVQIKYGQKSPREIATHYNLPIELIKDIGYGKIARKITRDLDE